MKKQTKKQKRLEIRILNPLQDVFDAVAIHAENNKRTMSKEGEVLIEEALKARVKRGH